MLTKKSTATTNTRCGFDSSVFIKINATWIVHRLPFVARYFGVICLLREPVAGKKFIGCKS